MSDSQKKELAQQQAAEKERETKKAEQERKKAEERETCKRLREVEARIISARKPGRPKKQKVDAHDQSATINVSSAGRANVSSIHGCRGRSKSTMFQAVTLSYCSTAGACTSQQSSLDG